MLPSIKRTITKQNPKVSLGSQLFIIEIEKLKLVFSK